MSQRALGSGKTGRVNTSRIEYTKPLEPANYRQHLTATGRIDAKGKPIMNHPCWIGGCDQVRSSKGTLIQHILRDHLDVRFQDKGTGRHQIVGYFQTPLSAFDVKRQKIPGTFKTHEGLAALAAANKREHDAGVVLLTATRQILSPELSEQAYGIFAHQGQGPMVPVAQHMGIVAAYNAPYAYQLGFQLPAKMLEMVERGVGADEVQDAQKPKYISLQRWMNIGKTAEVPKTPVAEVSEGFNGVANGFRPGAIDPTLSRRQDLDELKGLSGSGSSRKRKADEIEEADEDTLSRFFNFDL